MCKDILKDLGLRLGTVLAFLIVLSLISYAYNALHPPQSNPPPNPPPATILPATTSPTPTITPALILEKPKPTPTPTPKPAKPPTKIDLNEIEHVYVYYTENVTKEDEHTLKLFKEVKEKYFHNVTFCEYNFTYHTIMNSTPPPKYVQYVTENDPRVTCTNEYAHAIWNTSINVLPFPAVVIKFKDGRYAFYHGVNYEYLVPNSTDWCYAQITGKIDRKPVYSNLKEYYVDEFDNPYFVLPPPPDPDHVPDPIKPLNPKNITMIILATCYIGPAFEKTDQEMLKYLNMIVKYAPQAKIIKLTNYMWFNGSGIVSDPPGYESYWDKYVVPYAKFQDYEGKWRINSPTLIVFTKDGSVRVYQGADVNIEDSDFHKKCLKVYYDWCNITKLQGKRESLLYFPPTEKLFLDIWSYLNNTKT